MTTGARPDDVTSFIDGIENEARREDSRALLGLMRDVTGEERARPSRPGAGTTIYGSWTRPVECGRSRETVKRSDLAGYATDGYCASHSRFF